MRAVIGRIPDGTYEFEDRIDDDGITRQADHASTRSDGRGREMTVDLSGCWPAGAGAEQRDACLQQCRGDSTPSWRLPTCPSPPTPAAIARSGSSRPKGWCVNARHPAPVVHRIAIAHRLRNRLFGALHQAVPDRMPGRLLRRFLCRAPSRPSIPMRSGARCWSRSRSAAAARCLIRTASTAHVLRHAQQHQHPDRDDRERQCR